MNKLLAVLSMIVVVAACSAVCFSAVNESQNDADNADCADGQGITIKSDYSLLDPSNVCVGLTATYTGMTYLGEYNEKIVVTSLDIGIVGYKNTIYSEDKDYSEYAPGLISFSPNNFDFDYTSASPSGVEVVKTGDVYTIDGTYVMSSYHTFKYTSLKITYNGSVTDVIGTRENIYVTGGTTIDKKYELFTEGAFVMGKATTIIEDIDDDTVETFYNGSGMIRYDASLYAGAEITTSSGTYDGLNVTIYTINGIVNNGTTIMNYSDYKIYVYNGFELYNVGTINNSNEEITMSIYVA